MVNISSVAGLGGNPGQAGYAAGKAGIVGLTKTLCKEWGRYNVCVNAVAFGAIMTRMTAGEAGSSTITIKDREIKAGVSDEILEAMDGLPVTIRLLDPPLHEFLPSTHELGIKEVTVGLTDEESELLAAARLWEEANPMLGTRGVRLGVIKPGLYAMQVRALMEAASLCRGTGGPAPTSRSSS